MELKIKTLDELREFITWAKDMFQTKMAIRKDVWKFSLRCEM